MAKKTQDCRKCNGTGYLEAYAHVANGVCFHCAGTGKVAARTQSAKATAKKLAKLELEADVRLQHCERSNRRSEFINALYADDKRLRVTPEHPYYYMHSYELAVKDGTWHVLYAK